MIVETVPQILAMSIQEKFLLAAELWHELLQQAAGEHEVTNLGMMLEQKLLVIKTQKRLANSKQKFRPSFTAGLTSNLSFQRVGNSSK